MNTKRFRMNTKRFRMNTKRFRMNTKCLGAMIINIYKAQSLLNFVTV